MKTILLCLFPVVVVAQQFTLTGIVAVFNSQFESGTRQYVAFAEVEEMFQRATPAVTSDDGVFHLVTVGIKERTSFELSVKKPGYEVVNIDQLRAVAGQRDPVRIYMAPSGKIAENKRRYYQIGRTESEKALSGKIAQKEKELESLIIDKSSNQNEINRLRKEIETLNQRFQTIDQNARELAERFSRVNLDDASELYQRAFLQFQAGSIDSAIMVLEEVNWEARVDSILVEEAKLFAVNQLIQFNNSIVSLRRDSLAAALSQKIQVHLALNQYQEALHTGEWLIRFYEQDTVRLAGMYQQNSWLALLECNYALAALYVQCEQGISGAPGPTSKRYAAYASFFLGQAEAGLMVWNKLNRDSGFEKDVLEDIQKMEDAGLPPETINHLRNLLTP